MLRDHVSRAFTVDIASIWTRRAVLSLGGGWSLFLESRAPPKMRCHDEPARIEDPILLSLRALPRMNMKQEGWADAPTPLVLRT